jgi:hypothetical protein
MKTCNKCLEVKQFSEFTRRAALADGYVSKCKQCQYADGAEKRCFSLVSMKICGCCGARKIGSAFHPHPCTADGLATDCKQCSTKHVMAWNSSNQDNVKKHHRNWCRSEQGRAKLKELANRYPECQSARVITKMAMQSGRLKPQPCMICGAKSEAHHPDYSRPLDVVWLCRKHHMETHYMGRHIKQPEFSKMKGLQNAL